ncbi:MAG: hypothetical protein LBP59_18890 [Planctomycetaceae bacterium]|nr:hypothetical protein [Planctomycetaceae bacterium]
MTGLYVASNPTALSSQFSLVSSMGGLADTLERLSTGLKINSGKDDPAGLIASSMLKAEITGTTKAITNTQRAISMISTADSSLGQINSLLTDIKGLVVEGAQSGTMNAAMIEANQMQINASIEAIDRIAKQTTYNGQKLLDGSLGFRTRTTANTADPNNLGYSDLQINSANFGTSDKVGVDVHVQETARRGTLYYNGTGVSQKTTFDVTGSGGTQSFTFGAGATNTQMAEEINRYADSTGVRASVEGLASRGTVVMSSAGDNNDIVITAKENGKDQGNYAFKIVYGDQENARVTQKATSTSQGVVEVMLQRSYHKSYENFAGILDIDVNTGSNATKTAVSMIKGDSTGATYYEKNTAISAISEDGTKSITMTGSDDVVFVSGNTERTSWTEISKLNGWTMEIIDNASDQAGVDYESKTIRARQDNAEDIVRALNAIAFDGDDIVQSFTAASNPSTVSATGIEFKDEHGKVIFNLTQSGAKFIPADSGPPPIPEHFQFAIGDKFELGGGGAANELQVTYAEGATVEEIQTAINKTGNATAALAKGVDGSQLVKNLIQSPSRVSGESVLSKTTSNATASHVVELINNKLGSMFDAALLSGDSGYGLVSFMDAAVDYGDVNLDNALRFTGMDDGPIVRLTTTDANGNYVANQKLSARLINPTSDDIKAGKHTPILQINLATDSSGNSTTTAKDIVALFESLTPEQTGGVSVSLLLPDGVDPNGRIWTVDSCGNEKLIENCDADYGNGIVKPTGDPGDCIVQQSDLLLLGVGQKAVYSNAAAKINAAKQPIHDFAATNSTHKTSNGVGFTKDGQILELTTATAAYDGAGVQAGADVGSLLNGVNLVIKAAETATGHESAAFDAKTGTLTLTLAGSSATIAAGGDLTAAINAAWAAGATTVSDQIRAYNGSHSAFKGTKLFADNSISTANADTLENIFGKDGVMFKMNGGETTGDVIEYQGITKATTNSHTVTIETDRMTSALNGVSFTFTNNAAEAGFNNDTGELKVFLSPETLTETKAGNLSKLVNEAVNGAIASNWEGIRYYTGTSDTGAEVTVNTGATTAAELFAFGAPGNTTSKPVLQIPPSNAVGLAGQQRGGSVADPALIIKAVNPDTEKTKYSGTRIVMQQDDNLQESTKTDAYVNVEYDEATNTLTIKANTKSLQSSTQGGVYADVLAKALNNNADFKALFEAVAPYNNPTGNATDTTKDSSGNQVDLDPTNADDLRVLNSRRTVAFDSALTARTEMIRGYMITSAENKGGSGTSHGVAMTGNNDDNQRLKLEATETGSRNFVQVSVAQGSFTTYCPQGNQLNYLAGKDAVATINGLAASADGNKISVDSADLSLSLNIENRVGYTSFNITGGGAILQLGPNVVSAQQMRLGIGSMLSTQLGGSNGKLFQLKTGGNADLQKGEQARVLADAIVNDAITYVAKTRGRLGAIQRSSLEPNVAMLQDSLLALTEANQQIEEADFAEESSNLTRYQLLIQSGMQGLSLANQLPQYAASLIRG